MVIFLILLVLGFVVPSILNHTSEEPAVEPRICNTDADCYLVCDDQPINVLCVQNLCATNTCEERNNYEYNQIPLSFTLNIKNVTLEDRGNDANLFVKFSGNFVQSFNPKLSLYLILEKANIILDTQCLTFDLKQYCSSDLMMKINGNVSTVYGNYIPSEGDLIELEYWLLK